MEYLDQVLVFMGAAVILVPIFQRLGFGSVLGYLIAGVFVGPHALKLIRDPDTVMHFSELGVVLLLFMIGLEIQPRKLWSMRQHLLGLGGLQIGLCTGIFTGIAMLAGLGPVPSVVIGFSLSLSSTAFAIQTLIERNQFNTEFGRGSFSILLMQDLVAIPALALIPLLGIQAVGHGHSPNFLMGTFLIVVLVVAGRFLLRPTFRLIAVTRSREIFTAAMFFIVLGVAVLMQKVGLSAALGTFIAGVLLADSEYRHEIEADLEPFKSLLMGLFFIAVGMGVRLDLVFDKPVMILTLAVLYLAVKALVIFAVAKSLRFSFENSKQMALTVAQGGEFAFVIFALAAQGSIVPGETLALLTAVITISMALSPLLTVASERWTRWRLSQKELIFDQIRDETPEVIIAGFGRFGQVFARILRAQGIPFVAVDHDADQIELVRKFGNKVYYGDVTRADILEAAGAAKAKYLILAIDDVEQSLQAAKTVKANHPNLKIFARARNRGHAFDLMNLGITSIKREVFDSSIYFVRDLLVSMGFSAERAFSIVEKFKVHDEIMMDRQFKVRHDDKMLMSLAKQGTAQLEQVLAEDSLQSNISR